MKIFVSSTNDLKAHRDAACGAIRKLGHECVHMADFPASSLSPAEYCQGRINECDLFIGIIGPLRGSMLPDRSKSFVEFEYECARGAGKPCLMFLSRADFRVRADDAAQERDDGRILHQHFRARLGRNGVHGEFSEQPDAIGQAIAVAVAQRSPTLETSRERFIADYRKSLSALYSSWDLGSVGIVQASGTGPPTKATLDEMYVPLRLGKGFDALKVDRGDVIGPETLISRGRVKQFVIRGAAGAGKSTWMRWTFRRLLSHAKAFPIMMELRRLAQVVQAAPMGRERSLQNYLQRWAEQFLGSDADWLLRVIEEPGDLVPVLLIDGWDELGDLGAELREQLLGFMAARPLVRVIVTCRPYGKWPPSHTDGFEVLDIQPLSDEEISQFAQRFYAICYGEDRHAAEDALARLQSEIRGSSDAASLARTPLLLTMMLLISRSRELPDKRHRLFEACIWNFLVDIPRRKVATGMVTSLDHWLPDDGAERLQVVARMAHTLQEQGYHARERTVVVRTWDDMAAALPPEWPPAWRFGFLRWLAGPAGLLVENSDDMLSFCHLNFQEYLVAWHLEASIDGEDDRIAMCRGHMTNGSWWETIRLWAAVLEGRSRAKLEPVLAALLSDEVCGMWLVGAMLADGIGNDLLFLTWTEAVAKALQSRPPAEASRRCALAWSRTRQDVRRQQLRNAVEALASEANWLQWIRYREWVRDASLPSEFPLPPLNAGALVSACDHGSRPLNPQEIGVARVLCAGAPIWPGNPQWELALLNTWPSVRRLAGMRLQSLANAGASLNELKFAARKVLQPPSWDNATINAAERLLRDIEWEISRHLDGRTREVVHANWIRPLVAYWVLYLGFRVEQPILVRSCLREAARLLQIWYRHARTAKASLDFQEASRIEAEDWVLRLARDWDEQWESSTHVPWLDSVARGLARSLGVSEQANQATAIDFAKVEVSSVGRVFSGFWLARLDDAHVSREVNLISDACAVGFESNQTLIGNLERKLADQRIDPLWVCLARHLAGRSSKDDRAFLTHLASVPDERNGDETIYWGLRYIVRGDVVLNDGTIVPLDGLADEVGRPHLSYLDPARQLDWDRARSDSRSIKEA